MADVIPDYITQLNADTVTVRLNGSIPCWSICSNMIERRCLQSSVAG